MSELKTTLRIPGDWSDPGDLVASLPEGYRLTPECLILPDGTECEFIPMPPDEQFAGIFESACRQPITADDRDILNRHTVCIGLTGPAGSNEAARSMMQAAAALVRAGGAGVFIDNSALAHGGQAWIEMTEDGSPDAISYAFISVVVGPRDVQTMGMHLLGFPELVIESAETDEAGNAIVETVRSLCASGRKFEAGHVLIDERGPRFHAFAAPQSQFPVESPLHNPLGRVKLVSVKDIAAGN
ncbi:MAG TPA: hypothetical protein VM510_02620 [Caulifigura sp.]|jgi:hypothetical protein|nr:hypothetical protein [Caulifigura sp.]